MSLRQTWRQSKQTIATERDDERGRHARLLVMRDMLFAVLATIALGVLVLGLAPLPSELMRDGYVLLPFVVIVVAVVTATVSERHHHAQSPEYRRATAVRTFAWLPFAALVYCLAQMLMGASAATILLGAVIFLVVGLTVTALRYRRTSTEPDDPEIPSH